MSDDPTKDFDYCESLVMEWISKDLLGSNPEDLFPEYKEDYFCFDYEHKGNYYSTMLSWEHSVLANFKEEAAQRIHDAVMRVWMSLVGLIYSDIQARLDLKGDNIREQISAKLGHDITSIAPKYDREKRSFTMIMFNRYLLLRNNNERQLAELEKREKEVKGVKTESKEKDEILKTILEKKISIAEEFNKIGEETILAEEEKVKKFNKEKRRQLYISTFKSSKTMNITKLTKVTQSSYCDD